MKAGALAQPCDASHSPVWENGISVSEEQWTRQIAWRQGASLCFLAAFPSPPNWTNGVTPACILLGIVSSLTEALSFISCRSPISKKNVQKKSIFSLIWRQNHNIWAAPGVVRNGVKTTERVCLNCFEFIVLLRPQGWDSWQTDGHQGRAKAQQLPWERVNIRVELWKWNEAAR